MTGVLDDIKIDINDTFVTCYITEFTNNLKKAIRKHLSNICHGKNLAEKGLEIHSYKNTLTQFKNRYLDKTIEQKKGIMGELLSHVLIHEYFEEFDVASPAFNMEEKSQRKGFDLVLVSRIDNEIWITEVKSGELGKKNNSNAATSSFLHTAKRDLKLRLNEPEETFWTNAIHSANTAIKDCTDYKDAVIAILGSEGQKALEDKADSKDKNIILISVLFHNTQDLFDKKTPEDVSKFIDNENIFKKIITFAIQKDTYQRIEKFLFQEEIDG